MELYSGNGKISLAKRRADGSTEPRFFIGNCSRFTANFRTGELQLVIDQLKDETLEIVCGAKAIPDKAVLEWEGGEPPEERNATRFDVDDAAPFEYELSFEGKNTAASQPASWGTDFSHWRVHLFRVTMSAGENWDLISDDFASIKISAMAHKDERHENKRGRVYRIHKEMITGNRLTDAQGVVATV